MNNDYVDVILWAYILTFTVFGVWAFLWAREYWRYWRLQDQELGRIRRRE